MIFKIKKGMKQLTFLDKICMEFLALKNIHNIDVTEKLLTFLQNLSTKWSEMNNKKEIIISYNNLKILLLEKLKEKYNICDLDETKLALFNQATELYESVPCDSSFLGTASTRHLSLINTLFTGECYIIDDINDGTIFPILWNVNDQDLDASLKFNNQFSELLLTFRNLKKERGNSWDKTIDNFITCLKVFSKGGIKTESDKTIINDGMFNLVWNYIAIENIDKYFYILQVHIGADRRGGFSTPRIYEGPCLEDRIPLIFKSVQTISAFCPECNIVYENFQEEKYCFWDETAQTWRCGTLKSDLGGSKNKSKELCNLKLIINFF